MDLFRLAYVSVARRNRTARDPDDILDASRRNNRRDAITGLLIHDADLYFQVLEGPRGVTAACYSRICRDRRHVDVSLLWSGRVSGRAFAHWSMAYAGPSGVADLRGDPGAVLDRLRRIEAGLPDGERMAVTLAAEVYGDLVA
jgi:hypothetical protein